MPRIPKVSRISSICPPGVWCLTPSLGIVLILGILVAAYCIVQSIGIFLTTASMTGSPGPAGPSGPSGPSGPPVHVYNTISTNGDDRYSRAPEPLRDWQTGPDLRGALLPPGAVPINLSTRGLPQAYQQMGILKSDGQILPLYGRQTAYRSDRYNYYTRTDTYNPVQLPVRYEKRDCMDSIGCNELLGGEKIKIAGLGKDAHVEVYKFDGPTYIPGLV